MQGINASRTGLRHLHTVLIDLEYPAAKAVLALTTRQEALLSSFLGHRLLWASSIIDSVCPGLHRDVVGHRFPIMLLRGVPENRRNSISDGAQE